MIGDLKMKDYVGNFFKISALKAAVLGDVEAHGLHAFLQGSSALPTFNLCTFEELTESYANLKSQVQQAFAKKNLTVPKSNKLPLFQ